MINLGDRVEDKLTGFVGVVVAWYKEASMPIQYSVQPCVKSSDCNKGFTGGAEYFVGDRLIVTKRAPHEGPIEFGSLGKAYDLGEAEVDDHK